jgi:hypothetical protein
VVRVRVNEVRVEDRVIGTGFEVRVRITARG